MHQAPTSTPWHQAVLAWVNGTTIFAPLRPPAVRFKHPRSTFIVLGRAI